MKKEDAERINGAINDAMAQTRSVKAELDTVKAQLQAETQARLALENRLNQLAAKVFSGGATK